VQRGIQEVDVQVGCGGITVTSEHGLELLEPRNVFPSPRPVLPVHTSEKVCFVLNVCSNLTARFSTPTGKMVFVLRRGGGEAGRRGGGEVGGKEARRQGGKEARRWEVWSGRVVGRRV